MATANVLPFLAKATIMKYVWSAIIVFVLIISVVLTYKFWTAEYNYQASATVSISAKKDDAYREIAVIKNWLQWSQFNTNNVPDIKVEGTGADAHLVWNDPRGGKGTLRITQFDAPNRTVHFQVQTPTFAPMDGKIFVTQESEQDKTQVTMEGQGELPKSVFYAIASTGYGDLMSGEFQKGLNKLKKKLEKSDKKEDQPAG